VDEGDAARVDDGGTDWHYAVWGSSETDVYVASGGVILYSAGDTHWTIQTQGTTVFHGFAGRSATDIYAVGTGGLIVHSTGAGTWTPVPTVGNGSNRAVWGASDTDVFIAGMQVVHGP
jgi:hypothetical protein